MPGPREIPKKNATYTSWPILATPAGDWLRRARMIARSWDGLRTTEIACELRCHPQTVCERVIRFNAEVRMSIPSDASLTPQALCRRILDALRHRLRADHESTYLEMLLTYVIDLDPTADEFDVLLARYVADGRLGIADAARILQEARRRSAPDSPPPLPPLSETLRTLGALVDEIGAPVATIELTDHGAQVCYFGEVERRTLSPLEVQQESSTRAALRGQVAATGPVRYEVLLRTLGTLLEREYAPSYRLLVTPELIGVHTGTGHYAGFQREELMAHQQPTRRQRRSGKA